jgi:hypothetical protein
MVHNSYEWIQNFNVMITMVLHYVLAVAVVVVAVVILTAKFHCTFYLRRYMYI